MDIYSPGLNHKKFAGCKPENHKRMISELHVRAISPSIGDKFHLNKNSIIIFDCNVYKVDTGTFGNTAFIQLFSEGASFSQIST